METQRREVRSGAARALLLAECAFDVEHDVDQYSGVIAIWR